MNSERQTRNPEPEPSGVRISSLTVLFVVAAGPTAWFLQLCIGSLLSSWPCFPTDVRLIEPTAGYHWTRAAAIALQIASAILSAVAGLVAWRIYRRTMEAPEPRSPGAIEIGHGRTRFITLWGVIYGFSFAFASLLTLAGFILVPRCVG